MRQMNPEHLSSNAKKLFKLMEFDENESLISEIRKHPFGLFIIYFIGTMVAFALAAATTALTVATQGDPLATGTELSSAQPVIIVVGSVLILLTVVMMVIAAYLYTSDVVLVT